MILRDRRGRPYKKHIADVRDIVLGCAAALGRPEAHGEVIQLGGPGAFAWDVAVPHLAKRLGVGYADVVLDGTPTYYEYDLSKARRLLGFEPQYDICRMIDDALAFRSGKDVGMVPN